MVERHTMDSMYNYFYSNPNPLISAYNGIRVSPIHVGVLKTIKSLSLTVSEDFDKNNIHTTSNKVCVHM